MNKTEAREILNKLNIAAIRSIASIDFDVSIGVKRKSKLITEILNKSSSVKMLKSGIKITRDDGKSVMVKKIKASQFKPKSNRQFVPL